MDRIFSIIESQLRSPREQQAIWYAIPTSILAKVYSLLVNGRLWMYRRGWLRRHKLPGITVSIGNIVVGGTGKTPLVISLCNDLIAKAQRPAVLSRGFGSGLRRGEFAVFLNGKCIEATKGSELFADEARMVSLHCDGAPVIIGSNRWQAANYFIRSQHTQTVTHWILDDGFQHLALQRDVDLLVVSGREPFGNFQLLPRGILREPVSRVAECTQMVVVNPMLEDLDSIVQNLDDFEVHPPRMTSVKIHGYHLKRQTKVGETEGMLFGAVVGIANPNRFMNDLNALGVSVRHTLVISDHHRFDVKAITELARKCDAIATTAKDFWREPEVFERLPIPVFILELKVEGCDWEKLIKVK